jgi:hypothetical protein
MASIFGQNNDSKYQKNRLNEWRSGSDDGRGRLDWDASSFYLTRSTTGDHGGCRSHFRPRWHWDHYLRLTELHPLTYPSLTTSIPNALWRNLVHGRLVCAIICYPKDHTITLLLANVGKLGAASRRGSVLLPCMDLGLLWPLALQFHDARLRGSGPLGKVGQVR